MQLHRGRGDAWQLDFSDALDNETFRAQRGPVSMWKKQQREKLKAAPFPANWSRVLEERFPLYARLPAEDQKELQAHIQVFLAEKRFEGCGGLEITEEMKVCIAAQACVLLLHRETDYYPGLRSILVYPSAYFAKTTRHVGAGVM